MEAAADDLEKQVEAVTEAARIPERGMKEAVKEAVAKAAATKAAVKFFNYVSSSGTLSAATASYTTASTFARDPTSTISVVGVSRISGYTLIIIMI